MKILNWYITKSFLATFLMAIGVLTFGMTGNNLIKVFDYVANGVPIMSAMMFLLYAMPMALAFTIPWASLVSIMLVFGRMSADNEITAMRACGISILQIVSPLIVINFLLTVLCLYLQLQVGPHYLGVARDMIKSVAIDQPMSLFTPGIPFTIGDLRFYIGAKDADNTMRDIQVYVIGKKGLPKQDITAQEGKIEIDHETQTMNIILRHAFVKNEEGGSLEKEFRSYNETLTFPIEYGKQFNARDVALRDKYLTFFNIFARYIIDSRRGIDTTRLEVELNQRVALALAPIAFLLLGMPLAIRTSRRETSIGLFISVILAGIYYGGVLTSDAIRQHAHLFPQYIVWIPPFLFQLFGIIYITKIARK